MIYDLHTSQLKVGKYTLHYIHLVVRFKMVTFPD